MHEASVILEREISALANLETLYRRQLTVFPKDSPDWRGAKQALDVVLGRVLAIKAALKVLKKHPERGLRP